MRLNQKVYAYKKRISLYNISKNKRTSTLRDLKTKTNYNPTRNPKKNFTFKFKCEQNQPHCLSPVSKEISPTPSAHERLDLKVITVF